MSWNFTYYEYYLAVAQLVLATLGMGVTLGPRDFVQVLRAPVAIGLVLAAQLILAPCLALLVAWCVPLPPGFAAGLVLMTAMPVAALASIFCYLGRGHVPLAISATAITNVGCLLTTMLVLRLFGGGHFPARFDMPVGRILLEICCFLLLPLAVAMGLRRLAPQASQRWGKWCIRGSLVVLTTIVVGSLTSGRLQLAAYGWSGPTVIIAFAVMMLAACYGLGFSLRLPIAESYTVAMLVVVRNGNLALLVQASLLKAGIGRELGDGLLFVILFYGGTSLVIAGVAVWRRRALEGKGQALVVGSV